MLENLCLTLEMFTSRVPPLSASDESRKSCTVGMASMILTLLSSAWFPLDLSAHQDALILAGNLLAGTSNKWRWVLRHNCDLLVRGTQIIRT